MRVQTMREMEEGDWLRRSPRDSRRGMAAHMALPRGQDGPLLKPQRDRWQQLPERIIPLSITMEGYVSKHLILAVIFRRERRSCAKGKVGVCSGIVLFFPCTSSALLAGTSAEVQPRAHRVFRAPTKLSFNIFIVSFHLERINVRQPQQR